MRTGLYLEIRGLFHDLRTVFGCLPLRPDLRAALAARQTDEALLDVGEPEIVGLLIGVNRDRMAAVKVDTVDEDAVDAGVAHLAEGYFLGTLHRGFRRDCRVRFDAGSPLPCN
jgi:hypothetical protein